MLLEFTLFSYLPYVLPVIVETQTLSYQFVKNGLFYNMLFYCITYRSY
jgi:hypothetical protein